MKCHLHIRAATGKLRPSVVLVRSQNRRVLGQKMGQIRTKVSIEMAVQISKGYPISMLKDTQQ